MTFEFSAGGIVVKKGKDIEVLVAQHSQHHGWVFPKGLIDELEKNPPTPSGLRRAKSASAKGFGETKEEAALREVKEETGVEAKIIKPLTPITYWYEYAGEKRQKTVYYFLMEYVSGNITEHDWEMENVEWLPTNEVEKKLTYDSDKKVWQEAEKLLGEVA